MNNVQEGARPWCLKANWPKDLNALITKKFHLTTFEMRKDFLLLRIHEKEANFTYIWYIHLMHLHSDKFGPN